MPRADFGLLVALFVPEDVRFWMSRGLRCGSASGSHTDSGSAALARQGGDEVTLSTTDIMSPESRDQAAQGGQRARQAEGAELRPPKPAADGAGPGPTPARAGQRAGRGGAPRRPGHTSAENPDRAGTGGHRRKTSHRERSAAVYLILGQYSVTSPCST